MSEVAATLWERAKDALRAARHVPSVSPDTAASRAYYAAFYAVSALFALKERTFRKHTSVEAAAHRDLVKPGTWPPALGEAYSRLVELRSVADYGDDERTDPKKARKALDAATKILKAVSGLNPEVFALKSR
jgi:hypothetical protein